MSLNESFCSSPSPRNDPETYLLGNGLTVSAIGYIRLDPNFMSILKSCRSSSFIKECNNTPEKVKYRRRSDSKSARGKLAFLSFHADRAQRSSVFGVFVWRKR